MPPDHRSRPTRRLPVASIECQTSYARCAQGTVDHTVQQHNAHGHRERFRQAEYRLCVSHSVCLLEIMQ